jgi:putative transposase
MSRYRLNPTPTQEAVLRDHCGHARYTWNLAVEQHSHWHPGRVSAPGYLEQCRQLTAARAGRPWLVAGSQMVQQQALRDFAQAIPASVPAPGNGQTVGIDRGVAVSAALSTGQPLHCPALTARERARLRRLQRKLARATRGSNRRRRLKHGIARLKARETDRRKDWAERTSTSIARRFDLIRVEDLKITNMTPVREGNPGEPRPRRPGQSRAEPGHTRPRVGPAGAPAGAEGSGPGREDQTALHEPAVLGVRAGGPGLA